LFHAGEVFLLTENRMMFEIFFLILVSSALAGNLIGAYHEQGI
jgi:hypothetical protein